MDSNLFFCVCVSFNACPTPPPVQVDNTPLGPFQEDFALQSLSNNYRRPVIGFASDLERLGRREVASFFEQHYGPSSITVAVVGDCRPEQVRFRLLLLLLLLLLLIEREKLQPV